MLYLLRRIFGFPSNPSKEEWEPAGRGRARNFDKPRLDGASKYLHTSVVGTHHRLDDAYRIVSGRSLHLRLEREEGNRHDKNAIKVVGESTHGTAHIGYIGKEDAAQIVRSGLIENLSVLVDRVFLAHNEVDVRILIVGPADMRPQFDAAGKPRKRKTAP